MNSEDLITTKAERLHGFIWQARQKLAAAQEFFEIYRSVTDKLNLFTIEEIMHQKEGRLFIEGACFLSQKALNHMDRDYCVALCKEVIQQSLEGKSPSIEELGFRYALTAGEALGGKMRNKIGQAAQSYFSDQIIQHLQFNKKKLEIIKNQRTGKCIHIEWENKKISFDINPVFHFNGFSENKKFNKNVDFVMWRKNSDNQSDTCLACGELKGGIDPAGADEHWKTARSALSRIFKIFQEHSTCPPKMFFVGAAIEKNMAEEIIEDLFSGFLYKVANFNKKHQLDQLINHLINL